MYVHTVAACVSVYVYIASPALHSPCSRSTEAKTEALTLENPHASEGEESFESSAKERTKTSVPLAEGAVEEEKYMHRQ